MSEISNVKFIADEENLEILFQMGEDFGKLMSKLALNPKQREAFEDRPNEILVEEIPGLKIPKGATVHLNTTFVYPAVFLKQKGCGHLYGGTKGKTPSRFDKDNLFSITEGTLELGTRDYHVDPDPAQENVTNHSKKNVFSLKPLGERTIKFTGNGNPETEGGAYRADVDITNLNRDEYDVVISFPYILPQLDILGAVNISGDSPDDDESIILSCS